MVDLPKKKVGIVACSGEELPEGTVSRLATLKVLEQLRAADTVTICLPLFLAGGEGDRAFAKFYPTIAVDGCELRCAARGTQMYSAKPAASIVVRDVVAEEGIGLPEGKRRLNEAGLQAVDATAERIADLVDELLGKQWDRRAGAFTGSPTTPIGPAPDAATSKQATCACGSGVPVQTVQVDGEEVTLVGLPVIFGQFQEAGKPPSNATMQDMLNTVKIYNAVPVGLDTEYLAMLLREYRTFCEKGTTQ